ncbi:hypothetical protein H257_18130 [Aphanomyces astaci]|uniref:C2HC/C3H-type domain-containing protein n=1 Tax=Aphanomyces astaci TaxID=112090 RepID=W4FE49_APHAT|nr:hypothetical protein H257_18130 [Aphanomyces astaci]ETV65081.1 hypothetical protein H257_18130 [Aphanomyces astaci]|eukprot:XP_009845440.1 hypothetical protein H257_18130 [Aphanomyces astaci]
MRNLQATVSCVACHGLFFPASLPIHEKTCFRKNAFVNVSCPVCKTLVRSGHFHNHVASCNLAAPLPPVVRPAVPKPKSAAGPIGLPEADGRIKCRKCKRSFAPDRVEKHQSVCQERERTTHNQFHHTEPAPLARHPTTTAWRPPTRDNLQKKRPSVKSTGQVLRPMTMPPVDMKPRKIQAAPYDMILRDRSNQRGFASGGIGLSNATSAGNPLSRRPY